MAEVHVRAPSIGRHFETKMVFGGTPRRIVGGQTLTSTAYTGHAKRRRDRKHTHARAHTRPYAPCTCTQGALIRCTHRLPITKRDRRSTRVISRLQDVDAITPLWPVHSREASQCYRRRGGLESAGVDGSGRERR